MEAAVDKVLQVLDRDPHRQVHRDQRVAVDILVRGAGVDAVTPYEPRTGLGTGIRLVDEILERLGQRVTERMPEASDVELCEVQDSFR